MALRRDARHGRALDRYADEVFDQLATDPQFFTAFDDEV
jgi:hypothetical protein